MDVVIVKVVGEIYKKREIKINTINFSRGKKGGLIIAPLKKSAWTCLSAVMTSKSVPPSPEI